ncbi:MAG: hypothetical protein IJT16_14170 [Lachnospiraceae bacterium]|nr:hypothetical protein [Lachnospiraceae bacterium]
MHDTIEVIAGGSGLAAGLLKEYDGGTTGWLVEGERVKVYSLFKYFIFACF